MGLTFDALPEVAFARDLLRRWWGLELGLSDAKGGGYERTSHVSCETVRGAAAASCALAMTEIAEAFASSRVRGAVIKQCHAGMSIVAAPVYGANGLLGVVYATGARGEDATVMQRGLIATIGCKPEEAKQLADAAPLLATTDIARVRDLVTAAAGAVERATPGEITPTTFSHPFTEMIGDAPAVRDVSSSSRRWSRARPPCSSTGRAARARS